MNMMDNRKFPDCGPVLVAGHQLSYLVWPESVLGLFGSQFGRWLVRRGRLEEPLNPFSLVREVRIPFQDPHLSAHLMHLSAHSMSYVLSGAT